MVYLRVLKRTYHGTLGTSPMLSRCVIPGCSTLTMGGTCVEHDPPVTTTFERGRPFVSVPVLDSPSS